MKKAEELQKAETDFVTPVENLGKGTTERLR